MITQRSGRSVVYRALLEALCLGTRRIVELFSTSRIAVSDTIVLTGGLARIPLARRVLAEPIPPPPPGPFLLGRGLLA